MTIEAYNDYLYLRCGSGDGTVIEVDAQADAESATITVHSEATLPDNLPPVVSVSAAELVMFGAWLMRLGENMMRAELGRKPEDDGL